MIAVIATTTTTAVSSTRSGPGALVTQVVSAGVKAQAGLTSASIQNGLIKRTWAIESNRSVRTSSILNQRTGRQWISGLSPDFTITLDGHSSSSVRGWELLGVVATRALADPARPRAAPGTQLSFTYLSTNPASVGATTLERDVVLRPGSSILETTTTLINATLAPVKLSRYSLDELNRISVPTTQRISFNGGTDTSDDNRATQVQVGAFNGGGQVVLSQTKQSDGIFIVSERSSDPANRVGHDASGRTWAGVDYSVDSVGSRSIAPGGSLALGTAFTGTYEGGVQAAGYAFASAFHANIAPSAASTSDIDTYHPWGTGAGMSDVNLRPQAISAKQLGVKTFMLDYKWEGGRTGKVGDWKFDPARFPDSNGDGTPNFVDFLRKQDLNLGLWMSLTRFDYASQAFKQHPSWACSTTPPPPSQANNLLTDLGNWDLNNPQVINYLKGVVGHAVSAWKATEIKIDLQTWLPCKGHSSADYEDSFVSLVHSLESTYPSVSFELDETLGQRSWPFESAALGSAWFDNGHLNGDAPEAKQLHDLWTAAPWLTPSSIGFGFLDSRNFVQGNTAFLAPLAILSHFTAWTDVTSLSPANRAEVVFWQSWYEAHQADLDGASYELTSTDPIDADSPMVLEPWDGNHGELFAFWQADTHNLTVQLHGVDPTKRYTLQDARTHAFLGTFSGTHLLKGLTIVGRGAFSARVITVTPTHS